MKLNDLNPVERAIVYECLQAVVRGPFFEDWEFHSLFGIERKEVQSILESWPNVDESEEIVGLAINNALGNLLYYPHGRKDELKSLVSVSIDELESIFNKLRR